MNTKSVGFVSALIYTSISVVAALIFFGITLAGDYTWVARLGGTAWVFLLCMIILMPLVTSSIKRRYRE
ncbi:MAG: hypothetical protein Q8O16_05500 [Dehalococcoidia bacterium]|nr:hypothetical protein [Dehalococcoidia bacterium]